MTEARMMALGPFVFGLSTLAYQALKRKTSWRHADNARIGVRGANQFLGPGEDSISLDGVLYPELGARRTQLADLRKLGDTGLAHPMVAGTGEVMGAWIIESLGEDQKTFFSDGVPRRIDFSLSLRQVDEPEANPAPAKPAAES